MAVQRINRAGTEMFYLDGSDPKCAFGFPGNMHLVNRPPVMPGSLREDMEEVGIDLRAIAGLGVRGLRRQRDMGMARRFMEARVVKRTDAARCWPPTSSSLNPEIPGGSLFQIEGLGHRGQVAGAERCTRCLARNPIAWAWSTERADQQGIGIHRIVTQVAEGGAWNDRLTSRTAPRRKR